MKGLNYYMETNKTVELPKGTYKCTKAKANNPNSWIITEGQYVVGTYTPKVVVGERFHAEGQGFRDYISTSVVKDFELLAGNKVKIITENSVYMLEEIERSQAV